MVTTTFSDFFVQALLSSLTTSQSQMSISYVCDDVGVYDLPLAFSKT
jgi:hypothetical protein